jgi:hypothetical protein
MAAVAAEARQARDLMDRVETLEDIAHTLPTQDARRLRLLEQVRRDLAAAPPMRPRIAAELLGLSEKTVRAWTEEGILRLAEGQSKRLLLDAQRVHQILHLLKDLRAAGKTAGLLDEVHRRLVDATWLDRKDLAQSLTEMRRGAGTTRVPKPKL